MLIIDYKIPITASLRMDTLPQEILDDIVGYLDVGNDKDTIRGLSVTTRRLRIAAMQSLHQVLAINDDAPCQTLLDFQSFLSSLYLYLGGVTELQLQYITTSTIIGINVLSDIVSQLSRLKILRLLRLRIGFGSRAASEAEHELELLEVGAILRDNGGPSLADLLSVFPRVDEIGRAHV